MMEAIRRSLERCLYAFDWPRRLSILLSLALAGAFVWMNHLLHENRLWFSNIDDVEREISFRTECGLYYSYYKQLVNNTGSKSPLSLHFIRAVNELRSDQRTEAPHLINLIQRFNIFQEIILAAAYLILQFSYTTFSKLILSFSSLFFPEFLTPIFFYVYSCFAFTGFGVFSIYRLTLALTKEANWSSGLLAVSWLFTNLEDTTRVSYSINLRENFALPFFWLQNTYVVQIFNRSKETPQQYLCIVVTTLVFSAFWQFNQFILILQSAALFSALLISRLQNLSDRRGKSTKIFCITVAQLAGFLILIVLQGFQPMLLTALFIRFNLTIILSNLIMRYINLKNVTVMTAAHISIFLLILSAFTLIRQYFIIVHSDDSHIWEFSNAKIGRLLHIFKNYGSISATNFSAPFSMLELSDLPFESAIYLCHGAFAFLDYEFFQRTTKSGLFPLYVLSLCGILFVVFHQFFISRKLKDNKKENQASEESSFVHSSLFYFSIQSVLSGIMACLILRLKFLWLPQMAVIAACFSSHLLSRIIGNRSRTVILTAVAIGLLYRRYDAFRDEMLNEQEFYDPDTVQLMNWISSETAPNAIFAGSMQLMAGVKCCANRPIANHPHFEDKQLRERTRRIYQIYAKKTPSEIYESLQVDKVDYIILEESICFAPPNGCTTAELMDLVNHHIPSTPLKSNTDNEKNLHKALTEKGFKSKSNVVRFCDRIRIFSEHSPTMFRLSFQNPTFRVYQVLRS